MEFHELASKRAEINKNIRFLKLQTVNIVTVLKTATFEEVTQKLKQLVKDRKEINLEIRSRDEIIFRVSNRTMRKIDRILKGI